MEESPNKGLSNDEKIQETNVSGSPVTGICRIPEVILTPIDIRAYLTQEKEPLNRLVKQKETNDINIKIIDNFKPKEFNVTLIRDDLEALKEKLKYRHLPLCCKICSKRYSTTKKLKKHEEAKHMMVVKPQKRVSFSDKVIVHELKEYHKCRKCSKIFEKYELLKIHMRKDHKKRKCFVCIYCTKSFADRSIFKLHVKSHCDACGKFFSKRREYLEHRREVCKIVKKYKCKTCKESFFHRMDLRDHSYEHLGTFFICDICKDQFHSKCEVTHHITYLHSQQLPKNLYEEKGIDTKLKFYCNSCNEMSSDKALMESHTQALPDLTNEAKSDYGDYYFCQNCLKKFMSKITLEEHQKSHLKLKHRKCQNGKLNKTGIDNNDNYNVKTFNSDTKLPPLKFPKIVLERIEGPTHKLKNNDMKDVADNGEIVPLFQFDVEPPKKVVVDPVRRKTLFSKYRCELCGKHMCNNFTLRRHILNVHAQGEDLQCKVCEETFANRLLLQRHRCIRQHIPETEIPFDDARPEIYFDNMMVLCPRSTDTDYEAPQRIVELTDCDGVYVPNSEVQKRSEVRDKNVFYGYEINVQEVPIEF